MLLLLVSLKVEKFSIGYKLRNGIPSKRTGEEVISNQQNSRTSDIWSHTLGGNPALFFTDIVVVVDDIQC